MTERRFQTPTPYGKQNVPSRSKWETLSAKRNHRSRWVLVICREQSMRDDEQRVCRKNGLRLVEGLRRVARDAASDRLMHGHRKSRGGSRPRGSRILVMEEGRREMTWRIYRRPNLLHMEKLVLIPYFFFCFRGGVMGLPELEPP